MADNSKGRSLFVWLSVLLAIFIDQVIKIAVKTSMALGDGFSVFGDWFQIRFIENNGMAFGMELFNKLFLTGFRVLAIAFLIYVLVKLLKDKSYPLGFVFSVGMILAGAAGNLIDCLFYGEIFSSSYGEVAHFVPWGEGYASFFQGRVVDMFYFPLFVWPEWLPLIGGDIFFSPVFNFADACISCSVVAILIWYRKFVFKG
ncbi:MAG: lipoprotein signal peptidase [Bacteroidaceae bacterium]|nr:lipoprotein signal peptidase [Bacteroidaceae bacterium]